jgi:hypothetical protein
MPEQWQLSLFSSVRLLIVGKSWRINKVRAELDLV